MGGRGASSKIPTAHPGGGGGGGNAPFTTGGVGMPITTLKAALGKKGAPMSMATAVTMPYFVVHGTGEELKTFEVK